MIQIKEVRRDGSVGRMTTVRDQSLKGWWKTSGSYPRETYKQTGWMFIMTVDGSLFAVYPGGRMEIEYVDA